MRNQTYFESEDEKYLRDEQNSLRREGRIIYGGIATMMAGLAGLAITTGYDEAKYAEPQVQYNQSPARPTPAVRVENLRLSRP